MLRELAVSTLSGEWGTQGSRLPVGYISARILHVEGESTQVLKVSKVKGMGKHHGVTNSM